MARFSRPGPRLLIAAAVAVIAVTAVMFMAIQASQKPTAAWAQTNVNINPAHIGATAEEFAEPCTGPLANPPGPGFDGWHFVLPDSAGDSFESITVTFSNSETVVAGPITSRDPNNPDSGPGWEGFIDEAGNSGAFRHAYIFTTPAGMEIVSGTAVVTPTDPTPGNFNLSHACPASASPSPSPSPSRSVSPSPSVSPSRSVSPSPSISTSPAPSASTSRPPRPSPSRTRPPGYGYGSAEHATVTRVSVWRSYFG